MSATIYAKDKSCASCKYWTGKRHVSSPFSRTVVVENGSTKEENCLSLKKKTKPTFSCPNWVKIDNVNI